MGLVLNIDLRICIRRPLISISYGLIMSLYMVKFQNFLEDFPSWMGLLSSIESIHVGNLIVNSFIVALLNSSTVHPLGQSQSNHKKTSKFSIQAALVTIQLICHKTTPLKQITTVTQTSFLVETGSLFDPFPWTPSRSPRFEPGCPIFECCKGTPRTVQASGSQKCRSVTDLECTTRFWINIHQVNS